MPKVLKTIFLTIFIFQMIGLIFLLAAPNLTQAADAVKPITFTPQVEIGTDITKANPLDVGAGDAIGIYIKAIYKYAIGIVGIVAATVLMMAGVIWLTAGGNQTRIGEAKSWIGAALTGLIIALTSYMILYIVNPDLVNFRPIDVATVDQIKVAEVGCCEGGCSYNNQEDCETLISGRVWKTSIYAFECNSNTCKTIDFLSTCVGQGSGSSCKIGANYGYCDDDKCLPCKSQGDSCGDYVFGNLLGKNSSVCVSKNNTCGNGEVGERRGYCDCKWYQGKEDCKCLYDKP